MFFLFETIITLHAHFICANYFSENMLLFLFLAMFAGTNKF
jgi:hypothetical protein